LDAASADALRFVARRLVAEGIVMLFATRDDPTHAFEAADLPSLQLAGLGAEAAARLLAVSAEVDAAPTVRDLLVEQTRGNALALVELQSALSSQQLAGTAPLPEMLPVPHQLERVFIARVAQLPADAQRLLLIAAADDSEDIGLVIRAASTTFAALDPAEASGLISVNGTRLDFRHPLVRSAIYGAATSSERRAAHAALARALADDDRHADRRVWHLAASTLGDSAEVLRGLEEAAARAESRNAHVAAAKALQRAAALTNDAELSGRLLTRAARDLSLAGRDELAVACARTADPVVTDPLLRADLAEVQELAAVRGGRPLDVVGVLIDAARDVASVAPPRGLELLMLARMVAWQAGDRTMQIEISELAASVPPPPGDDASEYLARSLAGFGAMLQGDTEEGIRLLREVIGWGATADTAPHVLWASFAAVWLADRRYGELVDRAARVARDRGELGILADALGLRAMRLANEQRFPEARVAASEAVELVRTLGARNLELLIDTALALIAAFQGRDEEARERAQRAVELATAHGLRFRASTAVYALAVADMSRGGWSDAVQRLDSLLQAELGHLDPVALRTIPDKIEAAVRAGSPGEVRAALPLYEALAAYSPDRSLGPRLAACRALLAEGDEATEHFEAALALAEDAYPLDLARIQLLYGEHLRRSRRRTDARSQLRAALDSFERLGAEPWAERARSELRASGETARKRDPSTLSQLTPQELQVAHLVADGLSNKEVAAQLFLSPRTIDAHLRSVFAKLGITSRTQLARLHVQAGGLTREPVSAVAAV
jgi:DNA-binding CsgD family transcriptional regulator